MTGSLWNKYYPSRKTPEVPVKRSPKVARKYCGAHLNLTHRGIGLRWAGKYMCITIIIYYAIGIQQHIQESTMLGSDRHHEIIDLS